MQFNKDKFGKTLLDVLEKIDFFNPREEVIFNLTFTHSRIP